jgi:hypothetical protein
MCGRSAKPDHAQLEKEGGDRSEGSVMLRPGYYRRIFNTNSQLTGLT